MLMRGKARVIKDLAWALNLKGGYSLVRLLPVYRDSFPGAICSCSY